MEEKTYNLENIFSIVTCSCSVLSQITRQTSHAKTTDCSKMKVMQWLWKMVFVGCILLIIFLSSFPWLVEPPRWGRVRWIPFLDVLRAPRWMLRDTITNFFLYLPLGFSYARLRRSSATKMIFKAALAGLFLSMSCEFYQVFSPVRFPTMTDVCMNTLGAFAGALLATRYPSSQAHSPSQ
jgi:glycopeptide antibiotics resistance protein